MVRKRRPHDEVREAVVAAALEAIARGGLNGLTARGVAGAVGVSVGTIYNLFGDLDGVLRAVNLDTLDRMRAQFADVLERTDRTPESRLIALADAYFDFARAAPHRWQALFHYRFAISDDDPRFDETEAALFGLLRQAAGRAARDDALQALWAAVHGVVDLTVSQRMKGRTGPDGREYIHLIVRAGLRGLAALEGEATGKG